jgi:hypothetical protein
MIRRFFAVALAAVALPAAAQSVPAANYSDIWFNPNESGWGVTFTQHTDNAVEAVWYTYDPRAADPSSAGNFKPLWIVMPGGTWSSPTQFTGDVYVTLGTPFAQAWNPSALGVTKVGTFTFNFSSASTATFAYNISPPGNLASTDPAFGLPAFAGSKSIQRQAF